MMYSFYSPKILIELRTYVRTYVLTYVFKRDSLPQAKHWKDSHTLRINTEDEAEQAYGRDQSLKLCREFDVSQKAEAMMRT